MRYAVAMILVVLCVGCVGDDSRTVEAELLYEEEVTEAPGVVVRS